MYINKEEPIPYINTIFIVDLKIELIKCRY